ncbi:MAG TPA: tripartite tricarboxylate transporter substrate binding protein [Burkholderiales bacterium]|nr:tripartite tricarboxylate transporter substrate binding protein [Burkholderiales bacterium]
MSIEPQGRFRIRSIGTGLLILLCAICVGAALPVTAQQYPAKPIRMIVPYAPGGGSDIVARIAGQRMTEALGQVIIIDNRPGAAGMLGADIAAGAPADGYTLLLADSSFTINSSYYTKQVHYDVRKHFVPVALIADTPYLLVVHPGVPASSLKDFIALGKSQPGRINVGSAGNGSGSHLTGELFKLKAGVDLNHIPYKGSGPSTADVVAGQIQATFATAPGAVPFIKAGRLKALVVASARRNPALPDVPTFVESGFSDIVVTNWYGIVAPAGTAKPVMQRLYDETGRAIALPDVRERLAATALEPVPQSPDRFRALIDEELTRWARVIRDANIKTE